jgi:hypothetical protein
LAWDAEHAPANVGFSHNVLAHTRREGDQVMVETITAVQSVDLVADPATTRGLFEAAATTTAILDTCDRASELAVSQATLVQLEAQRPDLVAAIRQRLEEEYRPAAEELDRLRAQSAADERRLLVRRVLEEHRLPDFQRAGPAARDIVGEPFLQSLWAAADEAAVRALVEERARLVHGARNWRPPGTPDTIRARDQTTADDDHGADSVRNFVRAIAGRR